MIGGEPALVIAGGETLVERGVLTARSGVSKKQVKLVTADSAHIERLFVQAHPSFLYGTPNFAGTLNDFRETVSTIVKI